MFLLSIYFRGVVMFSNIYWFFPIDTWIDKLIDWKL